MFVNEGMANGRSPKDDKEEAEDDGHDEGETVDPENSARFGGLNRWHGGTTCCRAILVGSNCRENS